MTSKKFKHVRGPLGSWRAYLRAFDAFFAKKSENRFLTIRIHLQGAGNVLEAAEAKVTEAALGHKGEPAAIRMWKERTPDDAELELRSCFKSTKKACSEYEEVKKSYQTVKQGRLSRRASQQLSSLTLSSATGRRNNKGLLKRRTKKTRFRAPTTSEEKENKNKNNKNTTTKNKKTSSTKTAATKLSPCEWDSREMPQTSTPNTTKNNKNEDGRLATSPKKWSLIKSPVC